jgi:hypothetical protein
MLGIPSLTTSTVHRRSSSLSTVQKQFKDPQSCIGTTACYDAVRIEVRGVRAERFKERGTNK